MKKNTQSKANLFIIRFPFQLLSAEEAIHHFKLTNNRLIVIINFSNPQKHKEQLKNLIDYNLWDNVTIFEENQKSNLFKHVKLIYMFKQQTYNYIFIKNSFLANDQLLLSNLQYKKLILLEDGTITFRLVDRIVNKAPIFYVKPKMYRYYLLGLKIKKEYTFDIFTMFDLPKLENYTIHKHNFEYLRQKYKIENKNYSPNTVYIIGQQHVENGYLELQTYLNFIESVINKYQDCKIIYLMHRKEETEKFNALCSKYKNFELLKSDIMGELYFIHLEELPKTIIGTASTLLFSLNKFFPNLNLLSYVFDDIEIVENHQWFHNNYNSFKQENIQFITKKDLI